MHQVNLDAQIVVVLGKGGKERMVPMGGASIRTLKAWLARRDDILNPPDPPNGKRAKRKIPRRVSAVFVTRLGTRDDPGRDFSRRSKDGRPTIRASRG